jgi:hypothetical protein
MRNRPRNIIYNKNLTSNRIIEFNTIIFATIAIFLGAFSLLTIINQLGGPISAMQYADLIRNPAFDNTILLSQTSLMLLRVSDLLVVSAFLTFFLLVIYRRKIYLLFFLSSALLATYYLIFSAGKFTLLTFIGSFFIYYVYRSNKFFYTKLIVIVIITLLVIPLMDSLFHVFYHGISNITYDFDFNSLLNQFSFPFSNVINLFNLSDYVDFRYGVDFYNWILIVLPNSLISIFGLYEPVDLSDIISNFYISTATVRISGGTPVDIITFLYFQFGYISIFLIPVFAYVISKINNLVEKFSFYDFSFLSVFVLVLAYSIVFNIEFANIVLYRSSNLLILLYLFYISRELSKEVN